MSKSPDDVSGHCSARWLYVRYGDSCARKPQHADNVDGLKEWCSTFWPHAPNERHRASMQARLDPAGLGPGPHITSVWPMCQDWAQGPSTASAHAGCAGPGPCTTYVLGSGLQGPALAPSGPTCGESRAASIPPRRPGSGSWDPIAPPAGFVHQDWALCYPVCSI